MGVIGAYAQLVVEAVVVVVVVIVIIRIVVKYQLIDTVPRCKGLSV